MDPLVLVLTGPTGTGKSDWAALAAQRLPLEIVSVDSALVYRGLDIGTAKPERELRVRVPHHLIDLCEPTESYSAGRFISDAMDCIAQIHARTRIPLLTGGTMLYLHALIRGMAELPQASAELRQSIDRRAAEEGWPALHRELEERDPEAAARIHPNDPQRIQRALEVHYASGRPISQWQKATRSPLEGYAVRRWALVPEDRAGWHSRLETRFDTMLERGFLDEVRTLHARGDLNASLPAIRAVGYRQLWAHLEDEYDFTEARRRAIAATRQLAKRQLTWLRAEPQTDTCRWLDPHAAGAFERWCREVETALR